jgi:DNA-binding response OmpR family regulator
MPRVLILEDETVLRASMARGLAKLPAEVDEAGTLARRSPRSIARCPT